jgi:hypothetical protein
VIAFLPGRLLCSALAQGLAAALAAFMGAADPWRAAAAWWPVYTTITDILCLLWLVWLTRREGITLSDLVGVKGGAVVKQLAWAPVYLLAVVPAVVVASIITQAFYGAAQPANITVVQLPMVGALYSAIVWPVIWVITEELVYLGYLLPRIEALSGKTWVAVLVVTFFWGFQHLAIPFLADQTYLVSRVLTSWVVTGGMTLVFVLGRRRLVAMISVHYLFDLATSLLVGILPLLRG